MADVSYRVLLDGSPLPPQVQGSLQQVQVEDHADLADILRIRAMVAANESGSGWSVLDDEFFARLANIRVEVTIGGDKAYLIDSYVVETRVELSNSPGGSFVDVVAMDPSVLMSLDQKQRAWPNMSDSDIAQAIFGEYGMSADVEDAVIRYEETDVTTTQFDTDIAFLRKLAGRNSFECYVDLDARGNKVGRFRKPRVDEQPQGVLTLGSGAATNVNTFKARHEMLKPVEAVALGLDAASVERQEARAQESTDPAMGKKAQASASERPRRVFLTGSGLAKGGELQAYAQAVMNESAFAITAEGELNTVAYGGVLRAKKPVLVRGAGLRLSGVYYVERVTHTFSGAGYVQKFSLRRNALGLRGRENFAEDHALAN